MRSKTELHKIFKKDKFSTFYLFRFMDLFILYTSQIDYVWLFSLSKLETTVF